MPTITQQKLVAPGESRSWALDIEAMARCSGWARERPEMLQQQLDGLHTAFPTFLAALGVPLADEHCWVEAAEPLTCPGCGDLVVFDRGTRCAACQGLVEPPETTVVGLVGRIPALISGRPIETVLRRRLDQLQRAGSGQAELFRRAVFEANGRRYLAPRFGLWFSRNWPHEDPPVMVWPEYFDMLDIPPDHVYIAPPYYRLCLYASWVEQPAVNVLQHRVAPRLLIDLMLADLNAAGKLDEALERLDASLYQVYNMVGQRGSTGARLRQVYGELMGEQR